MKRDPRLLAKPPVTRLGCLVLVRNRRGDVLLVNPDYMDGLILPDVTSPSQLARITDALANRTLPVLLHGQRAA
ncbi:hypothetical protein ACIRYZ_39930 [Kitasatospora sp. NPDC101155]|uniref:hypothetical protein n=1 Tax=Kitasatospora sp. NPDC101155 TaxID=3364097 RepID=UPI0037FA022F